MSCNAHLYLCINVVFEYSLVVLDKLVFLFEYPIFSQFSQKEGRTAVSLARNKCAHQSSLPKIDILEYSYRHGLEPTVQFLLRVAADQTTTWLAGRNINLDNVRIAQVQFYFKSKLSIY